LVKGSVRHHILRTPAGLLRSRKTDEQGRRSYLAERGGGPLELGKEKNKGRNSVRGELQSRDATKSVPPSETDDRPDKNGVKAEGVL